MDNLNNKTSVDLDRESWNVILQALCEMPYRMSALVINNIQSQLLASASVQKPFAGDKKTSLKRPAIEDGL